MFERETKLTNSTTQAHQTANSCQNSTQLITFEETKNLAKKTSILRFHSSTRLQTLADTVLIVSTFLFIIFLCFNTDSIMQSELKRLHHKRGAINAQITLFKKYFESLDQNNLNPLDLDMLQLRLNKIYPLFDNFQDVQNEIDELEGAVEPNLEITEGFQNSYFSLITNAKAVLNLAGKSEKDTVSNSTSTRSSGTSKIANVKLPQINLPIFSGKFTEWREFFDLFSTLIHNSTEISDTQKLCYLRSCLKDEPAEMIMSIKTTEENYLIAWNALKERYDNKRRIVYSHVDNLLAIQPMKNGDLRIMINTISNNLQCLKTLHEPVDNWSSLIIPIIVDKLDSQTKQAWESHINKKLKGDELPNIAQLLDFLKLRQNIRESTNPHLQKSSKPQQTSRTTLSVSQPNCLHCLANHDIYKCPSFLDATPSQRIEIVKKLKLCFNCLRKGHLVPQCQSSNCRRCKRKHNTLLHINRSDRQNQSSSKATPCTNVTSCISTKGGDRNYTVLPTALINVFDSSGKMFQARAVLDSLSQSNFITKRLFDKLNLNKQPTNKTVSGISQSSMNVQYQTKVKIASRINNYTENVECLVIQEITSLQPGVPLNLVKSKLPSHIQLADPSFSQPNEVDLLLGTSIFFKLLCVGQIQRPNVPTLQKTKLGWIVAGELLQDTSNPSTTCCLSMESLNEELQRFWKVDEIATKKGLLTAEEQYCEDYFQQTTTRNESGKFVVRIPFKPNLTEIGDSSIIAKQRFLRLEKRLANDEIQREQYSNFMFDYKNLGHMTQVADPSNDGFYLPHHPVIREDSETTKLRVVFDGSCKLESGLSINAAQCVGPTIQEDLFSILLRFRTHEFVITGDIEKMYREVLVHEDDRKFQQIFWRNIPEEELQTYQLNTVTYGTAAAPFLAIRCLLEIAKDISSSYQEESRIIQKDFYVDDVLTGAKSIEELKKIKANLTKILQNYGFPLRKWRSNVPSLNENIKRTVNVSGNTNKALGVFWNPSTDEFFYSLAKIKHYDSVTKRTILSVTAQLFDPLGLLAPIIIIAKLIIQTLWQLQLSWDESIPNNVHEKWSEFKDHLNSIANISIPRFILTSKHKRLELHGFSDASERAYGACIYVKATDDNGYSSTNLLVAKSRVAPLKKTTLPRLELLGAHQLAQLSSMVKTVLNLKFQNEFYWTDSQIVLCWIKSPPQRWKNYVANRVSQIQELTDANQWYHVKSADNPADLISRGCLPSKLINCEMWWKGPKWLNNNNKQWSPSSSIIDPADMPEQRKTTNTLITVLEPKFPIEIFSTLNRLKRVTAHCIRFIKNCQVKERSQRSQGSLSAQELDNALSILARMVQTQCFPEEYSSLQQGKSLHCKSKILSLTPFIDSIGLIRVGGRLKNSKFSYDKRHPVLLPAKHHFTKLVFEEEHKKLLHAGPTQLLSSVRDKFWAIAARNIAKAVVRRCITCSRYNHKMSSIIMGNLPSSRLEVTYPFHTLGVDYAGPILIRDKRGRGSKLTKCYIALFVCFTTKAVHLEPVTSLSSSAFIAAFRRFVARRGKPYEVYSDNGKNFIGAKREMDELSRFLDENQHNISETINNEGIKWHFIPAHSPHFGGIWEAGVKSTKYHLKRVTQNACLTYEEMYTLLSQIESVLNSRPLSPISSDPNDLQALTPAHFLIGRTYTSVPDPSLEHVATSRLDQFQHIQKLNQHFWSRWAKEYVSELQQRTKWKTSQTNLEIGSLVLIKEDNLPPANWQLGRIVQIHPGSDGVARVATIKCAHGTVKRAFSKICVLPMN